MANYDYWSSDLNTTEDILEHHGIKGQKWGVRRYQNKGGSWTIEGLYHRGVQRRLSSAANTSDQVDEIFNSLTPRKKQLLGSDPNSKHAWEYPDGEMILKRYIQKCGEVPVSFIELVSTNYEHHKGGAFIDIATKEGYEGKGYASKNVEKAMNWAKKHKKLVQELYWAYNTENLASKHLAEKFGFKFDPSRTRVDELGTWEVATYTVTDEY